MAMANYSGQIGQMRKENPSQFATDEDAYSWGQKYYGWDSSTTTGGGSGTGSGTGGRPAGWGDLSKYSDVYSFTPTDAPAFTAPTYEAITTPAPEWTGPAAFSYDAFTAPDATTVQNDPGYQFRLAQGVKARDASAAARGTLRGGNQMLALEAYGQGLASDEYQNAYNRALQTYGTNYGVARDTYGFAYDAATDAYNRGIGERNFAVSERDKQYDANYQNAVAEYEPLRTTWEAQQLAKQREAELNFDRGWQRDIYGRDDAFRRDDMERNDSYRWGTYRGDDAFRWEDLAERRRQFLAELGAR
ncbi:MAG TPA: hypothetical protein PKC83_11050 [Gemmatimonadaceae bacterium]|nr:hypothetical protein [Gemmatimonadaceae bacterium]